MSLLQAQAAQLAYQTAVPQDHTASHAYFDAVKMILDQQQAPQAQPLTAQDLQDIKLIFENACMTYSEKLKEHYEIQAQDPANLTLGFVTPFVNNATAIMSSWITHLQAQQIPQTIIDFYSHINNKLSEVEIETDKAAYTGNPTQPTAVAYQAAISAQLQRLAALLPAVNPNIDILAAQSEAENAVSLFAIEGAQKAYNQAQIKTRALATAYEQAVNNEINRLTRLQPQVRLGAGMTEAHADTENAIAWFDIEADRAAYVGNPNLVTANAYLIKVDNEMAQLALVAVLPNQAILNLKIEAENAVALKTAEEARVVYIAIAAPTLANAQGFEQATRDAVARLTAAGIAVPAGIKAIDNEAKIALSTKEAEEAQVIYVAIGAPTLVNAQAFEQATRDAVARLTAAGIAFPADIVTIGNAAKVALSTKEAEAAKSAYPIALQILQDAQRFNDAVTAAVARLTLAGIMIPVGVATISKEAKEVLSVMEVEEAQTIYQASNKDLGAAKTYLDSVNVAKDRLTAAGIEIDQTIQVIADKAQRKVEKRIVLKGSLIDAFGVLAREVYSLEKYRQEYVALAGPHKDGNKVSAGNGNVRHEYVSNIEVDNPFAVGAAALQKIDLGSVGVRMHRVGAHPASTLFELTIQHLYNQLENVMYQLDTLSHKESKNQVAKYVSRAVEIISEYIVDAQALEAQVTQEFADVKRQLTRVAGSYGVAHRVVSRNLLAVFDAIELHIININQVNQPVGVQIDDIISSVNELVTNEVDLDAAIQQALVAAPAAVPAAPVAVQPVDVLAIQAAINDISAELPKLAAAQENIEAGMKLARAKEALGNEVDKVKSQAKALKETLDVANAAAGAGVQLQPKTIPAVGVHRDLNYSAQRIVLRTAIADATTIEELAAITNTQAQPVVGGGQAPQAFLPGFKAEITKRELSVSADPAIDFKIEMNSEKIAEMTPIVSQLSQHEQIEVVQAVIDQSSDLRHAAQLAIASNNEVAKNQVVQASFKRNTF
jgi:hypothetical protein